MFSKQALTLLGVVSPCLFLVCFPSWASAGLITIPALGETEINVAAELSRYKAFTRTDCHSNIAKKLGAACLSSPDRMGESEKSMVAISLTLCSMHSALQGVPKECEPWNSKSDQASTISPEKRGRCLSALHRSPQDWTSYNVYLSDATQLCHVLSSRHDSDMAKETYANASRSVLDLLSSLKRDAELRARGEDAVRQDILDSQQDIRNISRLAEIALYSLHSHLDQQGQLIHQLQAGIISMQDGAETMWRSLDVLSQEISAGMLSSLSRKMHEMLAVWNEEISKNLLGIVHQHHQGVVHQQSQMELAIGDAVVNARHQMAMLQVLTEERMAAISLGFDGMDKSILAATKELNWFDAGMKTLNPLLETSLDTASHLKVAHHDLNQTIASAARESQALLEGLTTAQASFNRTMATINAWQHRSQWRAFGTVSVFGGPSLISADWGRFSQAKIAVSLLWWISDCLLNATILGAGFMISLVASIWLLAKSGSGDLLRRFSSRLPGQEHYVEIAYQEGDKIRRTGSDRTTAPGVKRERGVALLASGDVRPVRAAGKRLNESHSEAVVMRKHRAVTAPI